MNEADITIDLALSGDDQMAVKSLFIEYSDGLPVSLDFQGFNQELKDFPKGYVCLLLAKKAGKSVGAVGLRAHSKTTCEMKRLFVRQEAQGLGIGRSLSLHLMQEATSLGFKEMVLDSLKRLKPAVKLYQSLGFSEIEPFNFNPEGDVIYMRRDL